MPRPKGSKNQVNKDTKDVLAWFINKNGPTLQSAYERVMENDPDRAMSIYLSALEYVRPKLARQELVGDPDKPIKHEVTHAADKDIINRYLGGSKK